MLGNGNRPCRLLVASTRGEVDLDPGQSLAQVVNGVAQGLDRDLGRALPPTAIGGKALPRGFPQPPLDGIHRWCRFGVSDPRRARVRLGCRRGGRLGCRRSRSRSRRGAPRWNLRHVAGGHNRFAFIKLCLVESGVGSSGFTKPTDAQGSRLYRRGRQRRAGWWSNWLRFVSDNGIRQIGFRLAHNIRNRAWRAVKFPRDRRQRIAGTMALQDSWPSRLGNTATTFRQILIAAGFSTHDITRLPEGRIGHALRASARRGRETPSAALAGHHGTMGEGANRPNKAV